jgi:hypothetical protein
VPPLAEIQLRFRDAIVNGTSSGITPLLTGGRYPEKRLAIHQRHYETSLVKTLLGKFPATVWLVGTRFVTEEAKRFVHRRPPEAPCIAEYGQGFPQFLSECPGSERVPYLREFAELEWHVGHIAIAVDRPAVPIDEFSQMDGDALPDAVLTLQPGLCYLHASWAIDELMKLYLTDTAPERFELPHGDVWIEVRGARGEFHINRLDAAEFNFRKSILRGRSIGDASALALDVDTVFDPGRALAALINAGLVTAITRQEKRHDHS